MREKYILLLAYCFSGVAALIYEVTWTRALSLVLGNTVYALSTMLATFMGGLAVGAYLGGKWSDRYGNLLLAFALCELGIGVTGLLSIPIIYRLPSLYLYIYKYFSNFPGFFFLFQIFMCINVMIVPTVLMGATFPIVCKRITRSLVDVGDETGKAYSINTVGAVAGSFAAGFILIPAVGLKGSALIAAGTNTVIALVMLMLSGRKTLLASVMAVPALMLFGGYKGAFQGGPGLLNYYTLRYVPQEITHDAVKKVERELLREIFYEEHPEGLVRGFTNNKGEGLVLQVDGKIEGTGYSDVPNTLLLAYLPVASHRGPSSFLNIGLGAGVTLAAARSAVKEVDVVEINPGVLKAVSLHGPPGILEGVGVFQNDARNHLFRSRKRYDVIASQPSIPTEATAASLFTREFFELAASRLNQGGVMCQWIPYYIMKERDVRLMLKTFGSVFPYVYLWRVEVSKDAVMVGSREPMPFGAEEIMERVRDIDLSGRSHGAYSLLMGPEEVAVIVRSPDVPVNSDDRPVLEFNIVKNILSPAGIP